MTATLTAGPPPGSSLSEPAPARVGTAGNRKVRLHGVDAARGLALIGMMVIHVLPDANPATGGPAWTYVVSAGNASALFALLAGVSVGFTTGRARVKWEQARPTAASLAARAAVVAVIGLALGYTESVLATVILPFYAVMFLFAIPLVFLPTWGVGLAAITIIAAAPPLAFLLLPYVPGPTGSELNLGLVDLFTRPLGLISELVVSGEFPALIWIAYLCVGLFISRLNLSSARTASRMLIAGCFTAAAAQVISGLLLYRYGGLQQIWAAADTGAVNDTMEVLRFGGDGTLPATTWWWLALVEPHSGTPLDLLSTIGIASAVLAFMLLTDHLTGPISGPPTGLVKFALAAAGKMTLTFYTLHVMFINSIHDTYVPTTSLMLQAAAAIVFGIAWQATAGRGPLEAMTAALTRRARQFARRTTQQTTRRTAAIEEAQP
ncbi:MAG: heparan-alpha-glucosaminide N-acetyltransferase domain-containing protein [Mycobacterium sp.]